MKKLPNVHPGEVLREEFLVPLGMTAYQLAKRIGVPQTRVSEILHGRRAVTAETALLLGRCFHTTPQFWLNLQAAYDLRRRRSARRRGWMRLRPWLCDEWSAGLWGDSAEVDSECG